MTTYETASPRFPWQFVLIGVAIMLMGLASIFRVSAKYDKLTGTEVYATSPAPLKGEVMEPQYTYRAKYRSNYDGDTIRMDVDLGFGVALSDQIFRLYGVDAPELRGGEKKAAEGARDYVQNKLAGAELIVRTYKDKKGKYGRWLAEIFYKAEDKWVSLNQELINEGMAREYGE